MLTDNDTLQLSIIQGELDRISSTMTGIILGWDRIFAIGALVLEEAYRLGWRRADTSSWFCSRCPFAFLFIWKLIAD